MVSLSWKLITLLIPPLSMFSVMSSNHLWPRWVIKGINTNNAQITLCNPLYSNNSCFSVWDVRSELWISRETQAVTRHPNTINYQKQTKLQEQNQDLTLPAVPAYICWTREQVPSYHITVQLEPYNKDILFAIWTNMCASNKIPSYLNIAQGWGPRNALYMPFGGTNIGIVNFT